MPPAFPDITELRLALRAAGYHPVPVLRHDANDKAAGKRPTLNKWQIVCATASEHEIRQWTTDRTQRHCTNTGILCGELIGLDLDIVKPDLARKVIGVADSLLPATPLVRIGRAPKSLRVFRAEGLHRKVRTLLTLPDGVEVLIEALGTCNQFVAFGIHPQTKQNYIWPLLSPLDVPFSELPILPDAELEHFRAEAEIVLRAAGGVDRTNKAQSNPARTTKPRTSVTKTTNPFPPPTRDEIASALAAIPNRCDWHGWMKVGAALYDGLADDGEDLFMSWSSQSPKNDPAATRDKWRSFRTSPTIITIASLFYEARANGWRPEGEGESKMRAKPEEPPPHTAYDGLGTDETLGTTEDADWTQNVPAPSEAEAPAQQILAPVRGDTLRDADPDDGEGKRGPPMRERIVAAVVNSKVTFWCDLDGEAYATVPVGEHIERHRVRTRRFNRMVRQIYGAAHMTKTMLPGAVSDTAMNEAMPQFEAMALQNKIGRDVEVRLLRDDGAVWLDLGDADWTTIRIDGDGWRIVENALVPLIRPDGVRALPMPGKSPSALNDLRKLINVGTTEDFILIVSWLVGALHPEGPFPVLALDGEQGSGKSTTALMLRKLVDPNKAPHRAAPKTEADLVIAARNGRVVALDNISFIDADMADAICRVATGAGFSKRLLYSDGEEHIINVCRPVLLNGIPSLLARGDLADRALAITLPTIPDEVRRPETEVWAAFNRAAPGILALLLDGLATALRNLPTLRLEQLPRMADFCRLACAAAPAFGWSCAEVLSAIDTNRGAAVAAVIDADPVAGAVRDIAGEAPPGGWAGTATELLVAVNLKAPPEVQRERGWPKDGARLSARLKRLAPALRRCGVEVMLPVSGGRAGRTIKVRGVGSEKQRSERSERSTADNLRKTHDNSGTLTDPASVPERSHSVPERSA